MKSKWVLVSGMAVLTTLGACSADEPKLPEGVCEQNDDCLEGERCNYERSKCEDIYYPRRLIKPY